MTGFTNNFVNALSMGASDANMARRTSLAEREQNALLPLRQQAAQQDLEISEAQLTQLRQDIARGARKEKDQVKLKAEHEEAKRYMAIGTNAVATGDEAAWNMVTREFGQPGLPMTRTGLAILSATTDGIGDAFVDALPEPTKPEFKVVGNKLVRIENGEATPVEGINGAGAPLVNLNFSDQASAPAF